jgi:predicted flap endonuclease-1-like 5' DNA nuclease
MLHYLVELALLLLAAYFAGACIGCLLRKIIGAEADVEPAAAVAAPVAAVAAAAPARVQEPVAPRAAAYVPPPAPVVPPPPLVKAPPPVAPAIAAAPVMDVNKVERPKGIAAARGGKPDNLQRISGVGPKNEKILHGLGFFHFDQIAAWTAGQATWVDDHLKFNGRIRREDWIRQARLLAEGKEAEFTKQFGTGGLRNRQGDTQPGGRTRKT